MTRYIKLTQGKFAIVDSDMYEELMRTSWCAQKSSGRKLYYSAVRGIKRNGKSITIPMHRQILGLEPGDGMVVDHKNRNPLDNRRVNLRIASQAENLRNTGLARNNTSGYPGVSWDKKYRKWVANFHIHLGRYDDIEDAIESRRQAEKKYWGEVIHR